MRKFLLALGVSTLLFACKKNTDDSTTTPPARTGPNVTAANLTGSLAANQNLRFYFVNNNGGGLLTVPAPGSNQTWNYASVVASSNDTMRLGAASNSAFPTANFTRTQQRTFSAGGTNQTVSTTNYYEISNSGWLELGHSLPAMNFNIPGVGTLDYPPQNDVFTPNKLPITPPFPFYVDDSVNYNTTLTENSIANAPPFLSNAATATKYTYSGKIKAIATGKVSLQGFANPLDAMVIRRDQNITINFLLNGSPAPPALLSQIGVVDGQTTSTTYYDFYNYGGIGYLGYIAVQNNAVVGAYFRRP